MRRLFPSLLASVLFSCSLLLSPAASSQVPDPIIAAKAPIPGAGHDYIALASETVNPVDGSLTINLPLSPPPGRQLSFPFGLRYGSYEQFSLGSPQYSPILKWLLVPVAPFQFYGWSYLLPSYSATVYTQSSYPDPNAYPPYSRYIYCDGTQNYVFRIGGVQDTSQFQNFWPDPNNSWPGLNCPNPASSSSSGDISFGPVGSFTPSETQPVMQAVDLSGTTYQFPSFALGYSGSSGTPTNWGLLATTITDKNGNQIIYSGTQYSQMGNGYGGSQLPTPPGSYKDTLGRQVVSWSGLGNSAGDQVSLAGLAGNIVVKWESVNVSFPQTGYMVGQALITPCSMTSQPSQQIQAVSEIDLPNGQKYSFQYHPTYGKVSRITFPDGGYVRYDWGIFQSSETVSVQVILTSTASENCSMVYDTPAITDRWVSFDGVNEILHQHFAYTPVSWLTNGSGIPYWNTKRTTVTTTDGRTGQTSTVVYNYVPEFASKFSGTPWGPPVESSILYQDASLHTLKTVNKSWYNPFRLVGEQTILDNGQGTATLRCWAGKLVIGLYEYGFQQEGSKPVDPPCQTVPMSDNGTTLSAGLTTAAIGPLRRQTATVYHNFPSSPSPAEPDSITVSDGSGNQVKQTTFAYDGSSVVPSGAAIGLVAPPGSRGNPTSITRWLNTGGTSPTTNYVYYDTGQLKSATDPLANTTSYTYTDNFASGTGAPSGQTNAYLHQVTYPNGATDTFSWGYLDGLLRSHTDPNTQTTTYKYNAPPTGCAFPDGLNRLSEIDYPGTGKTTYCYNDSLYSPSATTSRLMNTWGTYVTSVDTMDGLGHVVKTLLTSDQTDCPSGDRTDTVYDGFGRVYTVSNPYCASSSGLTTYTYDALGRTIQVTHPDGSTIHTSYTGRATQVQDEGNGTQSVTRISQIDGLGRLAAVCEVSNVTLPVGQGAAPVNCNLDLGGTGFLTTYGYNTLDNLIQVNQGAMTPRSFAYDSLSHLTSAYNPESGTTTYSYDANGNLSSKTSPTATLSFCYDSMNRLTSKGYSLQTCSNGQMPSPVARFTYDVSSVDGLSIANPVGRLVKAATTDGKTATVNSYDPLGRTINQWQCTPQNCGSGYFALNYGYDLLGNMTSSTNGVPNTPVTFGYTYNPAARLTNLTSSLSDSNHPGTLLSSATYTPFGSPATVQLGNGVTEVRAYNSRLWLQTLTATDPVGGTATPGTGTVTIGPTNGTDQSTTIPATAGRGSAAVNSVNGNGSDQSTVTGAAPGSTTVTLNGSEKSVVLDPCAPCEPMGCPACPTTTYDSGYVTVKVNGFTATAYYGRGDTANSVASSLAVALNTSSSPVTAVTIGGTGVKMTAKSVGTSSNYSFTTTRVTYDPTDFAGTSSFWITPTSGALTGGSNGTTVYDTGTVSLIVNGVTASASYGQGDTTATVATKLQSAAGSLPVTVSPSGANLTLTAKTTGAGTNYSLAKSCSTSKPTYFSSASFCLNLSGSALTGGANAQTLYDTGTVSITVFGYTASYSYGQNDTPSTIAAGLASALSPSAVNGTANGAVVTLTAKTTGLATNYAFSASSTYNSAHFSSPSFTASPSGPTLTGGANNTVYSLAMNNYAPDGDVLAANDSVNGNWTYSYDAFNRLTGSNQNSGQFIYSYVYDAYGNRWQQNGLIHPPNLSFNGNNNRIDGYCYDASGNLLFAGTCPPGPNPAYTYTYDAENRLTQVNGGTTATYVYDANGRRVRKTTGSSSVDYLYDLAGNVITELSSTGAWNRGEIYAGGRHLATYNNSTTFFNHADSLGTERVRTTVSGTVYETCTSLPFGDALSCSTADVSPLHFTGKERDSESGLDNFGARYDASSMGRFMTPDSTAYSKPINPQTWNLYAYALNNPVLYFDPTGHRVSLANCKNQQQCAALLGNAALLPKGVSAGVDKKGNLELKGDLSKIKGGNALRLLQLVNSDKTANFSIGDRSPLPGGGTQPNGGGASGTPSEGYSTSFSVVKADPTTVKTDDLSGIFLGKDGSISTGEIPRTNEEETAAHELLGHVWGELIGGQPALVNGGQVNEGNLREALIAEDRVRNTDPSRGLKIRHQDSGQIIRESDLARITNPGSQP